MLEGISVILKWFFENIMRRNAQQERTPLRAKSADPDLIQSMREHSQSIRQARARVPFLMSGARRAFLRLLACPRAPAPAGCKI
jgi:hypothetical protein